MPTPYRGYTEIPGAVTPDVPYRVNLALREVDADVEDLARTVKDGDLRLGGRVAALEGSKAGDPLKVEDERAAALLSDPDSRTSGQLRTVLDEQVPAITAAAAAGPLGSAIRAAADEAFPGPLSRWGNALAKSETSPAIWVSLGSSTANGLSTTSPGLAWADRAIGYLSGTPRLGMDAVTSRPTAPGIYMYSGAVSGATTATYLPAARMAKLKTLAPQLITHMVGSNDYAEGLAPEQYRASLREHVARCAEQIPGAVQVLIHQQARNDVTSPGYPWEAYGEAMAQVAEEFENVLYLNADAKFRRMGLTPTSDRAGLLAEPIHMGNRGHALMADMIMQFLGTPIHTPPAEVLRADVTGGTFAVGEETTVATILVPPAPVPRRAIFDVAITATSPSESELVLHGYTGKDGTTSLPEGGPLQLRVSSTKLTAVSGSASWLIPANTAARLVVWQNGNKYITTNAAYKRAHVQLSPC